MKEAKKIKKWYYSYCTGRQSVVYYVLIGSLRHHAWTCIVVQVLVESDPGSSVDTTQGTSTSTCVVLVLVQVPFVLGKQKDVRLCTSQSTTNFVRLSKDKEKRPWKDPVLVVVLVLA